jgi:hypothetical protein
MSSDISFDANDLNDSKSAAMKMSDSFYPNGKVVYTNTTQSREDNSARTLTSADPIKILQGDGIYRNPAFALNGYIQNVQSSMHGVLAMASDADDIQVTDPDNPDELLKGAEARQQIAKQSILSTGYAPGGFESTLKAMTSSAGEMGAGTTSSSHGNVTNSSGQTIAHSAKGYSSYSDAAVFNGGSRSIALEDELSSQEKTKYQTKMLELNKKLNFSGSRIAAFNINFDYNEKTKQDLKSIKDKFDLVSFGGYKSDKGSYGNLEIDKSLIGNGIKKCYPSAALIEFLLQITDKIYIKGGQGTDRGILGSNFSVLTKENNSISDHAFGRGFDIEHIGTSKATAVDLKKGGGVSKTQYEASLYLLLDHLTTMPDELQPDLIIVSSDLITDLGINEKGLEEADSAIRKKYPALASHVNIGADGSHRDHIHISYGPIRAGSFVTPEIAAEILGSTFGSGTAGTASLVDKFKKTYKTGDAALQPSDVYQLLNSFGFFSPELSAIFTGIAHRESRYNPWSTNNDGFFGLWQLGTDPDEGGRTRVKLQVPSEEIIEFWKLGCNNWQEKGLTVDTVDAYINPIRKKDTNAGRAFFDSRYSIPLNQIACLRAKLGKKSKNTDAINVIGLNSKQNVLHPWGEGFLYHGWLSGVSYKIVKDVYIAMTKGTEEQLANWILKNTPKDSRTSNIDPLTGESTVQSWIKGKEYSILYRNKTSGSWNQPDGWPANPTPN